LDYAKGSYKSAYGKIESGWETNNGNLTSYKTTIPANTTATLYLPVEQSALAGFANIAGVTYAGMEKHNNTDTAKFDLLSGGYVFEVLNGKLSVSHAGDYVVRIKIAVDENTGIVTATISYRPDAGEPTNVRLCLALYTSGGRLISVNSVAANVDPYDLSVSIGNIGAAAYAKAFLWENVTFAPVLPYAQKTL
jgi:hypothetical protein